MASIQQQSNIAPPKEEETEERLTEVEETLNDDAPKEKETEERLTEVQETLNDGGKVTDETTAVNGAVSRYFSALGMQDVPAIVALYTDDGVFFPHNLRAAKGKEALTKMYTDIFQMIELVIPMFTHNLYPVG